MSDLPFGFGPASGDDDPEPVNPFGALFGAGGPNDLGSALQQIGKLLSYEGGPVNWDLARDTARQVVAAAGDASVSPPEQREVEEAVRLAEVWLDPVTALPAATSAALAWSRAEWVEQTLPTWRQLVDPLAERVVDATATAVPAEMQAMAGPMLGMVRQLGGAMFGAQVGQGIGALAGEVVGSTDVGLPLGPAGKAVLMPANVRKFGEGLEVPADEVRLYLALRECAHQRLFAHVPWLRSRLFAAVEDYARGISIDTSRLEQTMGSIDPSNPQAIQEALQSGLFEPEDTPAAEGRAGPAGDAAGPGRGLGGRRGRPVPPRALPSAEALRETMRRRRATGGPAEQTFATLVGLELRPRRLREAAALWTELAAARGVDGRDAVWAHPDLLPTAEDLDDPAGFVARTELSTSGFDLSELDGAGDAPEEPETPGSAGSPDPTRSEPAR